MTNQVEIFFLAPTDKVVRSLRRVGGEPCQAGPFTVHTASVVVDTFVSAEIPVSGEVGPPRDDPRWPLACEQCQQPIGAGGFWLVDHDRVYRTADGQEMTLDTAPAGACWNAQWYGDRYRGPDGRSLVVRLPGGWRNDWIIDSRASNCRRPADYPGKCWVRTGRPEDGTLDVRSCGCGAGAGSISTKTYHGHLRSGFLIACADSKHLGK